MILDSQKILSYFPLVMTAVLGALNDNLLKAAIIVFAAMSVPAEEAATVGLMAGGLLMLPFILFSGWAGILADKFEKAKMIRIVKWSELALSGTAVAAMMSGSLPLMLGIVFLMGTQSAFFGPLKFGWLPERLYPSQLLKANSWLDTGTFLAILAGTVAGGLLAGADTLLWVGAASVVVATVGVFFAHVLPVKKAAAPDLRVPLNPLAGNWTVLKALFSDQIARRAAILDAWFWAAGSIYLSTLPAYLRLQLGGDETMLTLVLALFAVGIGAGAFTANAKLRGKVGARMVLPAGLVICVASFGLFAGFDRLEAGSGLTGLVATPEGIFVMASLFLVAFGGGMFAVPLKALIQSRAGEDERAQVMAGFSMLSAISIVGASALMSVGVGFGLDISMIFLAVALSAMGAVVGSIVFFPRAALQGFGRLIFKALFRVEIEGEEHLSHDGPVVFVSNHVSFADGPLLFSFIDRNAALAVNTDWAKGGVLKYLVKALNIAPLDPQRPMAAKGLAHEIKDGGAALVFPEGRISTHGGLMKVYPGSAWLVDAADAPVVPISIEGLESSIFTRPIKGMARRWFPKVRIRVGAPRRLDVPEDLRGRKRREVATRSLHKALEDIRFKALFTAPSIPHAFHDAQKRIASSCVAISDPMGNKLSHRKISIGAAAFSKILRERTEVGEHVGVLLPGVAGAAVVLMGLWRAGRVAAILNPTLGPTPLLSAIETGGIKRILTSRDFVEKAGIGNVVEALEEKGIEIIWTDDLKAQIGIGHKLLAMFDARKPADVEIKPEDVAVILFTSGTEGAPKGVVLTHGNLVANVAQLRARTDVGPSDRVLSALPLFHSFGLTGGVLLPLMVGAPVMIYPTPLHYRIVPEMAYAHQATLVFGTDTFLSGWGRRADGYDFGTVRAAIAGAEPVKAATREMWAEKFGVRILEGYGATEAGPVIALNTPLGNKAGTVGKTVSHLEMRLEAMEGVEGKRLWVKGPNVMAGYLLPGESAVEGKRKVHEPEDGWYDTGDIVSMDDEGYISIVGRAKRFAKVGGEMVSLAAAETLASQVWPDAHVGAIIRKCDRKGEKVVLATTEKEATRKALSAAAQDAGFKEIVVPADVLVMEKIPLLASGKIDYPGLTRMIEEPAAGAA